MASQKRRSSSLENDHPEQVVKRENHGRKGRPVSLVRSMVGTVDNQLAGQVFDHFCAASTLKSILRSFRYLCEILRLKPNQLPYFYPKLKANLSSWKAQALWAKLDKRASQKCYNRGKACAGTRVLIIGAGPCGLRTAIEAQLLGAKVVVIEKRDRYSRNNVLHLWPYNIHELRALGAKKFYGKFCAGSIDHISIRQLQCILLKVCLLLGVEMFEGVSFEDVIEPTDQETGWRPRVAPHDHPVSQYEFDVLIGADGKRNTLAGFKRKEFRGKLAIAITANFINKHSEAEGRVEEISGVAFIFNQKFFNDLNAALGISLENIVYYKDETHYFVMTAKKQSLLNKGVLINNDPDPSALLAPDNINQEALFQYAREAADFATKGQLPHLDFAVNHYGKPDVAMFDFTSMYAADYAARVVERHGHRLLQCLVGDSLLEPFWPTGTGCPRGFFSALDAMWLMKQLDSGKMSVLDCLAERESIHRILSQTTPSNTCKNFASCSLDPTTRYPTVNLKLVLPFQVTHLYDTDNPSHLQPQNVLQESTPRKKKRKNSQVSPGNLLSWIQKQVQPYNLQVCDMGVCFKNGLVLCAIVHRYRPDLVHWDSLDGSAHLENIQFAFDVLEHELGLQPVITAIEIEDYENGEVDRLAVISYLTGVYELFRREIPQTQQQPSEEGGMTQMDDLDDSVYYHNHREKMEYKRGASRDDCEHWSIGQLLANDNKRRRRRSLETIDQYSEGEGDGGRAEEWEERGTSGVSVGSPTQRVSNKKRLAKLLEGAKLQETKHPSLEKLKPMDIRREESFQKIQELISGVAGSKGGDDREKKPKDLGRAIGRLDSEEWSLKQIQEREGARKGEEKRKEKVPKWSREAFNDKLKKVKSTIENPGQAKKNHKIDASLNRLQKKLTEGSSLETGERGANKVSTLASELTSRMQDAQPAVNQNNQHPELKRESSNVWQPPKNKSSRISDNCHFCQQKVYVVERMSAEGKFFHRACFRCDYCNILLRLGSYVYHREGRFAGKFFCIPHSTENALEKYRYKSKVDEIQAQKDKGSRREEKFPDGAGPGVPRFPNTLSPSHRERIMDLDRGGTPERAEFEASIDLSATEDDRQIMDEDEWTDLNFGTSTNLDTSDDSLSDLDTDSELQGGSERPLTADETREIAREWRARQLLDRHQHNHHNQLEDVRYTDQEYEDSSDPDMPLDAVPKVTRTRRRGRRVTSSTEDGTTEDTESITETEDSSNEEIKEIERRDNNPFNTMSIPKIVVDYNSPMMNRKSYPDSKYVAQAVPLSPSVSYGPTPPGTGLFNPSMSSNLYKYQFKTPDFTKTAQQQQSTAPQYRAISGILSNNLKKNWVNTQAQKNQTQKKVDPSEIDARLRSLMDRLSSQQSLLKPAEKPSAQMQHYLDSSANRKQEAYKMNANSSMSPETAGGSNSAGNSITAAADAVTSSTADNDGGKSEDKSADLTRDKKSANADGQNAPKLAVKEAWPDKKTMVKSDAKEMKSEQGNKKSGEEGDLRQENDQADLCSGEDSFTSLTDSSENSESSAESEPPELQEVKFDEVPEIMINLAEPESLQELNVMDQATASPAHHNTNQQQQPPSKAQHSGVGSVKLASPECSEDEGELDLGAGGEECDKVCDNSSSGGDTTNILAPKSSGSDKMAPKSSGGDKMAPKSQVLPRSTSLIQQHQQQQTAGFEAPQETQGGSKSLPHQEREGHTNTHQGPGSLPVSGDKKEKERERQPPRRRPSLLKTVVSIKGDNPEPVVNYEIVDKKSSGDGDGFDFIDDGSSPAESPDKPKNLQPQGPTTSTSTAPTLHHTETDQQQKQPHRKQLPNQAINIFVDTKAAERLAAKADKESILFLEEAGRPKSPQESSTDPPISTSTPRGAAIKSATSGVAGKSATGGVADKTTVVSLATQEDDGEFGSETDDFTAVSAAATAAETPPAKPPLPSAEDYPPLKQQQHQRPLVTETPPPSPAFSPPPPPTTDDIEEGVDVLQQQQKNDSEVWDTLKSANSVEKRQKLNEFQQKQSNIVHDLIMGIPRQRRVRQPRATIPSSTIPPPPGGQQDKLQEDPASPAATPTRSPASVSYESETPPPRSSSLGVSARKSALAAKSAESVAKADSVTNSPVSKQISAPLTGGQVSSPAPPLPLTSQLSAPPLPLTSSHVSAAAAPLAGQEDLGSPSDDLVLSVDQSNNQTNMGMGVAGATSKPVPQARESVRMRERSNSRSLRDSALRLSATISLPPTPITDPEKFGIKPQGGAANSASTTPTHKAVVKSDSKTQMTDSCSSFDTDGLDGIVSENPSPSHKSKSNNSSPAHKKGRGFMAAVTSIFRGSPSPITSPDSSKASPVHNSKTATATASVPQQLTAANSKSTTAATTTNSSEGGKQNSDQQQSSDLFSRMTRLTLKGRASTESPVVARMSSETSPPVSLTDSKVEMKPEDEELLRKLKNSNLPPHLMERLEKRLSTKGQMQANRAAMARVRRIQEIQRELGVVENECADIEKEGVELEKELAEAKKYEHAKLMTEWYRLLGEKNDLVRREQELMVESKQLELLDLADKEEVQLVNSDEVEATQILDKLARIAEQREQLEEMLARDRERYKQEDLQIKIKMQEQGIWPKCVPRLNQQQQ